MNLLVATEILKLVSKSTVVGLKAEKDLSLKYKGQHLAAANLIEKNLKAVFRTYRKRRSTSFLDHDFIRIKELVSRVEKSIESAVFELTDPAESLIMNILDELIEAKCINRITDSLSDLRGDQLIINQLGIMLLKELLTIDFENETEFDLVDLIPKVKENLGKIWNELIENRVTRFFQWRKKPLNKKEIVISLLILLTNTTSKNNGLLFLKEGDAPTAFKLIDELLNATRIIHKTIFGEKTQPAIISSSQSFIDAIQSTTGAEGLQGKFPYYYNKEKIDQVSHKIYFDLQDPELNLEGLREILFRISESLPSDRHRSNVLQLIEECVNNPFFLFADWQWNIILESQKIDDHYLLILSEEAKKIFKTG